MKLERPIQILVRRRAALGDVIMSTGVVRELKKKYNNNCEIDVATEVLEVYNTLLRRFPIQDEKQQEHAQTEYVAYFF